jgi:subtilisin-like proprotein convertase family protein
LSAQQVVEIIEQTASKDLVIASDTPVNVPGDFDANGFSPWFGHGKVNAAAAVARAGELLNEQERIEFMAQDVPLMIPDTGVAVNSLIAVNSAGVISDLRINVRITHSYIGDLVINLIAPDGVAVTLQNHQGGSRRNLDRIYSLAEVPALNALVGKPVSGTWTLRVADTWSFDQGQLDSWRLVAKLAAAPSGPGPTVRARREYARV